MLRAQRHFLVVVLACLGCHSPASLLLFPMCREVTTEGAAPAKAPAPAPAHPDFERLRAYRNYYSIARVGAYEHHFAVWFNCVEQSVAYYAVSPTGEVRRAGGAWGGLAGRPDDVPPIPAEQRGNERAVLDRHAADYEHESTVRVGYRGSYREIVVNELVPTSGPGDPYARMVAHVTATLRAGADLTSVSGVAEMGGGETRLCWRDSDYRDCSLQHWIDFSPGDTGTAQLPALASDRSPIAAAERARFQDAVLAAARRHAAGEPAAPLEDILARQGDTLLPPGLSRPFTVGFTLYARPAAGSEAKQADASLTAQLPVREALDGGVARAAARGKIAGVAVTAEIEMTAAGPRKPGDGGEALVPLRIRYRLTDDRGNTRSSELTITAKLLIDGDAIVVRERTIPPAVENKLHEPPLGQSLPGVGPYGEIDAYFGISAPSASSTWWP